MLNLSSVPMHTNSTGYGIGLWHVDLAKSPKKLRRGEGIFRKEYALFIKDLYDTSKIKRSDETPYVSLLVGDSFLPLYRRTLVKTRILGDSRGVILPLNFKRHWGGIWKIVEQDIPYEEKIDGVVWRGVSTGYADRPGNRFDFMKWCSEHPAPWLDAGFTQLVQGWKGNDLKSRMKPSLTTAEMLRYKFLVILEGNDIATGLKWALLSQSVVFMPPPTLVSWLMEDRLVPWVHYVPLRFDFADLGSRYAWAIANPDRCQEIARQSTQYMQQFRDQKRERSLMQAVVDFYVRYDSAPPLTSNASLPSCHLDPPKPEFPPASAHNKP